MAAGGDDARNASVGTLTFPFDVSGVGAEKLRHAVKAKLQEFSQIYADDILSEYVVVLVGHGKQKAQTVVDLEAFLGEHAESFVSWLWDHLTVNKQQYIADPPSVDPGICSGREEGLPMAKQKAKLDSTSHLIDLKAAQGDSCSALPPCEEASSWKISSKLLSSKHSRKLKDTKVSLKRETDAYPKDFDCNRARSDERPRNPVRERKRRRSPELLLGRERAQNDEKEKNKGESSSVHVVACRRLLASAIREAVAPFANVPKRTDSKKLRSITSDEVDESAKEDHKESKAKNSSTVWDRLGTKVLGRTPALQSVEAPDQDSLKHIDQIQSNKETFDVKDGMSGDGVDMYVMKNSGGWTANQEFIFNRDLEKFNGKTLPFSEARNAHVSTSREAKAISGCSASFGHRRTLRTNGHLSRGCRETVTEAPVQSKQRQDPQNHATEEISCRASEVGPIDHLYRFSSDKAAQDSQQNVPSSLEGFKDSQNAVSLTSCKNDNNQQVDARSNSQANVEARKAARFLRTDHIESSESDISEMRKRMRQVELEMTKLRARQSEVSKELQKASATPASSSKPSTESVPDDGVDARSVFVTNVHFAATKEVISLHFASCGEIVQVTILRDGTTGLPKGSAYVEFSSKAGVEKALNLNESTLLFRSLKCLGCP